jgi:hypothetical protein
MFLGNQATQILTKGKGNAGARIRPACKENGAKLYKKIAIKEIEKHYFSYGKKRDIIVAEKNGGRKAVFHQNMLYWM